MIESIIIFETRHMRLAETTIISLYGSVRMSSLDHEAPMGAFLVGLEETVIGHGKQDVEPELEELRIGFLGVEHSWGPSRRSLP